MGRMLTVRPDASPRVDTESPPSISFAPPESPVPPGEEASEAPTRDRTEVGPLPPMPLAARYRPGRAVHAYPIQQAKVQRPLLRAATLHRARLVQWLDDHVRRRLVLITAEAGYGKT